MRHHASSSSPPAGPLRGGDWRVIGTLWPYLWAYKSRVLVALLALVAAKVANVGVPILLKSIVDTLDARTAMLAVPLALLAAYGLLRLSTTAFTEIPTEAPPYPMVGTAELYFKATGRFSPPFAFSAPTGYSTIGNLMGVGGASGRPVVSMIPDRAWTCTSE